MSAHLLELHNIYLKELEDLHEKYLFEKDYIYNAMKQYTQICERQEELKSKLQEIEREMTCQFQEERNK